MIPPAFLQQSIWKLQYLLFCCLSNQEMHHIFRWLHMKVPKQQNLKHACTLHCQLIWSCFGPAFSKSSKRHITDVYNIWRVHLFIIQPASFSFSASKKLPFPKLLIKPNSTSFKVANLSSGTFATAIEIPYAGISLIALLVPSIGSIKNMNLGFCSGVKSVLLSSWVKTTLSFFHIQLSVLQFLH